MTATETELWQARWNDVMMNTYGTPAIVFDRAQGSTVWDVDGRQYLDLLAGIATCSLGHAHPTVSQAIATQAQELIHTSNWVINQRVVELAEKLQAIIGQFIPAETQTKLFFCQDGTTANEAAIKLSRKHGLKVDPSGKKIKLVSTNRSFHGRSSGGLSLTGNLAKRDQFLPLLPSVEFVDFGDIDQLASVVDQDTAAIFLEPIQGEGGVNVAPAGYLAAAREIATKNQALLVLDEVQTGIGRTGEWFAGLAQGVVPDVMSLAKGIASGMPLGVSVAFGEAAELFEPGEHGSTYGGNPVVAAAALAVLETIEDDDILANVKSVGKYWVESFESLDHPLISGVRGAGLLLGIELAQPVSIYVVDAARNAGFIVNAPAPDLIRLVPPLNITHQEAESFVQALPGILDEAGVLAGIQAMTEIQTD